MRGLCRTRPVRFLPFVSAAVVALLLVWPLTAPAQAADARLEAAEDKRAAVQQRLNDVLVRLDRVQAATAEVEDRVAALRAEAKRYADTAEAAGALLEARARDAYKRGRLPLALGLLTNDPEGEDAERARLLSVMAVRHRAEEEQAVSSRLRAAAAAEQVNTAVAELRAREAEMAAAREDVQAALAEAEAYQLDVQRTIASEEAARERAARERAARAARETRVTAAPAAPEAAADVTAEPEAADDPAPASSAPSASASVSGGSACPVGQPRSYSDTYGAPRSGGRSHLGTDILAPMGTPIYAYESGTITRMDGNSLGGISLYLQGDSGNVYYYTHLSGYAPGASVGRHVAAGTHIAQVGDTGNAAGIPHLHFEVMPGAGRT